MIVHRLKDHFSKEHNLFAWAIFVLALILRLIGLGEMSYSNDELSAIFRLDFDGLPDLLEHGVKQNDMHPAGVQVFLYYWSMVVGTDEFMLRLPFSIAGAWSAVWVYRIGARWISRNAGLLGAGLYATLAYPLLFGQLARPYAFGGLLVLIAAHYVLRILFDPTIPQRKDWIRLALILAGIAYIHYYAFLTAGWLMAAALPFTLRNDRWKHILLAGSASILLFLPHYGVLSYQMGKGALSAWLGKPESGWLRNYLFESFNASWMLCGILVLASVVGIWIHGKDRTDLRPPLLMALWFFGAFLIGYLYSLYINPILHHSVLLFAFPFLLLLIGLAISGKSDTPYSRIAAGVMIALSLGTTLFQKNYYGTTQIGTFREIAEASCSWQQEHTDNIAFGYNLNDYRYLDFYLQKQGCSPDTIISQFEGLNDLKTLRNELRTSATEYFGFGWSTRGTPQQAYEVIREFYPELVEDHPFENSRVSLFSKGTEERESIFQVWYHLSDSSWKNAESRYPFIRELTSETPYGPAFVSTYEDVHFTAKNSYLLVEAEVRMVGPGLHVVYQAERDGALIERENGKSWWGFDTGTLFDLSGEWQRVYYARRLDDYLEPTDVLKVFLWNAGNESVQFRNMRIRVF